MIIHGFPPNLPANKEGFKKFIYLLWKAFPDIRIIFDDIIIEKNKVACRFNLTGTHKGEFMDFKPTDKEFTVNGMTVFYFHDTKCIERWNLVDMISLGGTVENPIINKSAIQIKLVDQFFSQLFVPMNGNKIL